MPKHPVSTLVSRAATVSLSATAAMALAAATLGGPPAGSVGELQTTPAAYSFTMPSRGSATIGTARFPAPTNAVYVATTGNDANRGTVAAPKRSVNAAIQAAPYGGVVVVRHGTYHQAVTIPAGKPVTIQNYPGEVVWFDGTRRVSGWVKSGTAWVAPWTTVLDSSPTFTWGAPDSTVANWRFVNSKYPMAAHPDQFWIGSVEQRQVGSRAAVVPGTFYVNQTTKQIVMGSDPTRSSVVGSDLPRAFAVYASGSVIRGIGIRRYASSVPHQGVVTVRASSVVLDNVAVADSATGAIGLFGASNRLDHVTVTGAGQLGIQGHQADGTIVRNSVIRGSNDQRFNQMPAAGGLKLTSSRGVRIVNNYFNRGIGNAIWLDEACYDIDVLNNSVYSNTGRGVFLELSSKAVVADNLVVNSGDEGIVVRQTDRVEVWNNTVVGITKAIDFSKDGRTQSNTAYARDKRRPFPDPEMPWTIGNSTIANNVIQSRRALLSVEDYTHGIDATAAGFRANGNVYNTPVPVSPNWIVVWARPATDPFVYASLPLFSRYQKQELTGLAVTGTSAVASSYTTTTTVAAAESRVAQGLPSAVAAKLGRATGTKHLGYWR